MATLLRVHLVARGNVGDVRRRPLGRGRRVSLAPKHRVPLRARLMPGKRFRESQGAAHLLDGDFVRGGGGLVQRDVLPQLGQEVPEPDAHRIHEGLQDVLRNLSGDSITFRKSQPQIPTEKEITNRHPKRIFAN